MSAITLQDALYSTLVSLLTLITVAYGSIRGLKGSVHCHCSATSPSMRDIATAPYLVT
jgi:hypothetical protein